jgi:hypothetical protein
MPGFDGTGPAGRGPMTGGGRGWCNPYNAGYTGYQPYGPPYAAPVGPAYAYGPGRPRWGLGWGFGGRGRGFGRGRGWGAGRGIGRGRGW